MLLFLVMLLVVAVATENSDSSTTLDLESEMSMEMLTERSAGGSNSNSDDPSFNNSAESILNGAEFVSVMSTGMSMEHKVKRLVKRNIFVQEPHVEPYCDSSTERNVTVQLGYSANLCCRLPHLGDKLVTWVRLEDRGILAVGERVIAKDSRITSLQLENFDDWNLKIKSTTRQDAGVYMCQINTIPITSFSILLNIFVPKATIQEGSNLYIQSGTNIDLTCVINGGTSPLGNVSWFKGDIKMDGSGYSFASNETGRYYGSHLWIFRAQPRHSGNYTCKPFNADPASISVHVINGWIPKTTAVEPVTTTVEPVTVHHGQQSSSAFRLMPFPLLLVLLSILWILQRISGEHNGGEPGRRFPG